MRRKFSVWGFALAFLASWRYQPQVSAFHPSNSALIQSQPSQKLAIGYRKLEILLGFSFVWFGYFVVNSVLVAAFPLVPYGHFCGESFEFGVRPWRSWRLGGISLKFPLSAFRFPLFPLA